MKILLSIFLLVLCFLVTALAVIIKIEKSTEASEVNAKIQRAEKIEGENRETKSPFEIDLKDCNIYSNGLAYYLKEVFNKTTERENDQRPLVDVYVPVPMGDLKANLQFIIAKSGYIERFTFKFLTARYDEKTQRGIVTYYVALRKLQKDFLDKLIEKEEVRPKLEITQKAKEIYVEEKSKDASFKHVEVFKAENKDLSLKENWAKYLSFRYSLTNLIEKFEKIDFKKLLESLPAGPAEKISISLSPVDPPNFDQKMRCFDLKDSVLKEVNPKILEGRDNPRLEYRFLEFDYNENLYLALTFYRNNEENPDIFIVFI